MRLKYQLLIIFLVIFINKPGYSQTDSGTVVSPEIPVKKKWYKGRLVKASIAPVLLFGYGVSVIQNHGIYSSYDMQRDVQKHFSGFHTNIDDYLKYAPYAEMLALNVVGVRCKNDFLNRALIIIKSNILASAITYPLKVITNIERPNKASKRSFPSGHTTDAFVAATIIHKEFRYKSQWYGVAAYTLAATVGAFRILNNAHWQSDVFAGAGVGVFAVNMVYLTHKFKWGRNTCLVPIYNKNVRGVTCLVNF